MGREHCFLGCKVGIVEVEKLSKSGDVSSLSMCRHGEHKRNVFFHYISKSLSEFSIVFYTYIYIYWPWPVIKFSKCKIRNFLYLHVKFLTQSLWKNSGSVNVKQRHDTGSWLCFDDLFSPDACKITLKI